MGFSLVELSIVLVILGLLTGGILSGQSLIRAAELRSVSTDYQRYVAATYAFRDRYFAMPGDFARATDFWGIAGGTGADVTCRETISTGRETCNGDGDGWIRGDLPHENEILRFWQHLANAGLIEGQFKGVQGTVLGYAGMYAPGENIPMSKISGASWAAYYVAASAGTTTNFIFPASNWLILRGNQLTPEECWNVDSKMDDGRPATGKMLVYKGDAAMPLTTRAGQAPGPADLAAEYNFAVKDKICHPRFFPW